MPFSPRGIEQSLVLPPRWPLILYTGTLYSVISKQQSFQVKSFIIFFGLAAILEVTLNSVKFSWTEKYNMFIAFHSKGYYWFGVIHQIELNRDTWGSTVLHTLLLYLQDGRHFKTRELSIGCKLWPHYVDPTLVDNATCMYRQRINGSSKVLFWMDWGMVWHASRFDSFVPRWPDQICQFIFLFKYLLSIGF